MTYDRDRHDPNWAPYTFDAMALRFARRIRVWSALSSIGEMEIAWGSFGEFMRRLDP